MINLFNLIPIGSLDGGRIADAISPYIGAVGVLGGGALVYQGVISNPLFYLILAGGAYSSGKRLFYGDDVGPSNNNNNNNSGSDESEGENNYRAHDYYRIGPQKQALLLGGYGAVVVSLILAMKENNLHRRTPKQIQAARKEGWGDDERPPWEVDNGELVYDDVFTTAGMNND